MTIQAYQFAGGYGIVAVPNATVVSLRDPTTSDTISSDGNPYTPGQYWENETTAALFVYLGSGNWTPVAGSGITAVTQVDGDSGSATPTAGVINIIGGTGVTTTAAGDTLTIDLTGGGIAIDSFIPDAGTNPVVPSGAGAVTMAGTANQITTTGGLNTLTFSIPAVFIAPGSIASTTTLTGGTGITATTGNITALDGDIITTRSDAGADVTIEATNSDNTSGTSRAGVEIATGGASSGDPYLSFQISGVAASTMTMGLDNSASDIFVISNSTAIGTSNALTLTQAGALTATTTLTATLGAITATNGNLVLGTAGNKLSIATGANASVGSDTLAGGTVTVNTTAVTASSIILLTRQSIGATGAAATGNLTIGTVVAGTSFVINSVQAADATALQASDVSVIGWLIIN